MQWGQFKGKPSRFKFLLSLKVSLIIRRFQSHHKTKAIIVHKNIIFLLCWWKWPSTLPPLLLPPLPLCPPLPLKFTLSKELSKLGVELGEIDSGGHKLLSLKYFPKSISKILAWAKLGCDQSAIFARSMSNASGSEVILKIQSCPQGGNQWFDIQP